MKHTFLRFTGALAVAVAVWPAAAQQTTTMPPGYVPEFGTMWTFDAPPLDYWQSRYSFNATRSWLDHLRLAAVRLPGCSASFVSADGLVMTNHHCARSCISAVSPETPDYLHAGFTAPTRAEELSCPNLYVDQLVGIEDVTDRIRGMVTAASDAQRVAQREAAVASLQASCQESSGNRCQVVRFYNGGMYSLYQYRRFDDLRLVMAPELEAAFFGGDPDNFTYPRYDLDVTFLRVYEGGRPYQPEHYLSWSAAGAAEGEPVFVVGNPGSTGRLLTLAQMEYLRDVDHPARLTDYDRRLEVLYALVAKDPEAARRYENTIFGIENSKKAYTGYQAGLLDPSIMARKKAFEDDFRGRIAADPALQAQFGDAWGEIADAELELATFSTQARYYGFGGSTLLTRAVNLVRVARQAGLPDAQRIPTLRGEGLDSARQALLLDEPVDLALEQMQLAQWLGTARDELGAQDPLVRALLGVRTPEAAAERFIRESLLISVDERRPLVEGGVAAVDGCVDPLVAAMRSLEPIANSYLTRSLDLNTVISSNTEKIGQAIYAAYGKALPPDATFTLRISDGVVKGFPYNGTIAPYKTTLYGLYARSADFDDKPPFELSERWKLAEGNVDMKTPINFVSTADIIGGNSGSPLVNRAGEVVGLAFDGNIEMLPNKFIFTDEVSRTVSVHSSAIIEALRNVYGAGHIADELRGGRQ
ncbi:MAG TPA: S46 family peptidase [Longimicrobiales bacterium]|nr:S46 family peptidase [Longimicrobiales bacterium]